jgi:hypothetical protein
MQSKNIRSLSYKSDSFFDINENNNETSLI